jgi:hypothetical protein
MKFQGFCSAVTARPRYTIRILEIGNTLFATFPSLHFSTFCQITELIYGPGLTGHSVFSAGSSRNSVPTRIKTCFHDVSVIIVVIVIAVVADLLLVFCCRYY